MKLSKLFVIALLAGTLGVLGCGDDDGNGNGGTAATARSCSTAAAAATAAPSPTPASEICVICPSRKRPARRRSSFVTLRIAATYLAPAARVARAAG